jgi:hypothetical protein
MGVRRSVKHMTIQEQNIEIEILVHGKPLVQYKHEGRFFTEGKIGTEYSLRINNNNSYRVMIVVGIDGVNVIDSRPIGTKKDEAGYVIDAYGSLTVRGYRIDNENVAAFKFTAADKAYASKDKKLSGTTGVISVRTYQEKEKPVSIPNNYPKIIREDHHHYHYDDFWYPKPKPCRWDWEYTYPTVWCGTSTKATAGLARSYDGSTSVRTLNHCAVSAQAVSDTQYACAATTAEAHDSNPFALGSSWGQKTESKVKEVAFEVGNFLTELTLYYTTREGLKTLGIDVSRAAKVVFPDHSPGRYCEVPSGWNG